MTNPHDPAHQLTKREHFAVAALQGLLANPDMADAVRLGDFAIKEADALIVALNKANPTEIAFRELRSRVAFLLADLDAMMESEVYDVSTCDRVKSIVASFEAKGGLK